jgi:RNA polymerase sigma-70 factor (ECF subfamily)
LRILRDPAKFFARSTRFEVNDMKSPSSPFPATRWTWLDEASHADEPRRLAALEAWLRLYYPAMNAFVTSQFRLSAPDAEDCLQDFAVDKVISLRLLEKADRERGRFRTFLCQALNHFVIDRLRREQARKRAPLNDTIPLEMIPELELNERLAAGQEDFDRAFFREAIQETLLRMRNRCRETHRSVLWELFESRVLEQTWERGRPVPYEKLVPLLGLDSAAQAANLLTTAKRLFVRTLRSVVRDYSAEDEEVAREITELRRLLGTPAPDDA